MIFINILICIQFLLVIYVRAFLTPCLCSSEVENPVLLVYVRAFLTPCLCSSGVENLSDTMFTFERSREPCPTCLRSSGVENPTLLDTLFTFERSREPFLCSNLSDTMFTFERSREPFLVGKAESRTICYFSPCLCLSIRFIKTTSHTMFMFERSRELFVMQAKSRTLCYFTPCLCSSGVENLVLLVYVRAESRTFFVRQTESRTPFRIVHQNSIFES